MTEKIIQTYRNKQLDNGFIKIPHVVMLGAGASKAAFPNGDLSGAVLPLMDNLVEVVGLRDVLSSNGIKYEGIDIETIFSNVADDPEKEKLRKLLEKQIFDYFAKMQIQDELTIYDKLILSLRDKDIVATFNWDPSLLYAYRRCGNYYKSFGIKMPTLVFLHGNVALGVCYKDNVLGPMDSSCSKCSKRFTQVPLLYPVLKKIIHKTW